MQAAMALQGNSRTRCIAHLFGRLIEAEADAAGPS